MAGMQGVFLILGYAFGIFYSFWPVIVLAPLGWRRGNILLGMIILWGFMLIGWLFALSVSLKPFMVIIPEPLNTFLFLLTGAILVAWPIVRKARERQYLHRTANNAENPQDLLDISPTQFEKMVVELYNLHGYKAERIGATGDHGVDVLVHTPNGEKWVVQCKRWRGSVGEPVVREFFGTMHHEKADRGILVTTGTFSYPAQNWAKGKPIHLINGREFLNTWKKEIGESG